MKIGATWVLPAIFWYKGANAGRQWGSIFTIQLHYPSSCCHWWRGCFQADVPTKCKMCPKECIPVLLRHLECHSISVDLKANDWHTVFEWLLRHLVGDTQLIPWCQKWCLGVWPLITVWIIMNDGQPSLDGPEVIHIVMTEQQATYVDCDPCH
jgi:hypothetical protein